jgi:cell division septation protein DedD
MRTLWLLVIAVLALALLVGCSDKQKEAAELEAEMKDMEGIDTSVEVEPDTTLVAEPVADAEAVPEETQPDRPTMPPVPRGEGYTVQVASCENEDYAWHLVEVYSGRGYEPYVTTITFEGQTYYRVRIGDYSAIGDARALQDEIKDRFSKTTWIDRLDQ